MLKEEDGLLVHSDKVMGGMGLYQKISNGWLKHWDFILLDLIFLQIAYVIPCIVRSGWRNPYENQIYLNIGFIICLADICTAFFMEDYSGIMRRGYFQEFEAVIKHVSVVSVIEVLYLFLSKTGYKFSRFSFVLYVLLAILLLYGERLTWKHCLVKHKRVFYNKRAILIITTSRKAECVIATVLNHTYNELEVIGAVILDSDHMVGRKIHGVEVVCTESSVPDYIQTRWVDGVLINVARGTTLPEKLITTCIEMGVAVHTELAVLGENSNNQQLDRLGGYLVLSTNVRMATSKQLFLKRLMDICGAIAGLVCTGLITIVLAPAIYLASPGPVFFSQVRVGRNGRKFRVYKFRSMYMDAEERKKDLMEQNEIKGFMFKMNADPRIIGSGSDGTRHGLGWFIRKTSIDEFPQFWNILKGEMSLVGTRPPTVDEWEQYEHHHRARMAIKPGLTGMWQVSGRSDITDFEEVVRLDMEYIQNWNIAMDIKILLKTVLVVFKGQGSK